jgi:hypothetical protein
MHGYNHKDLPNPCIHTPQDFCSALSAGLKSVDVDVDVNVQPGPDRLRPAAATSVSHPARPRPHRSHVARQRQPRLTAAYVMFGYRYTAPGRPSRLSTYQTKEGQFKLARVKEEGAKSLR